jgi:hypothetical protein
MGEVDIDIHTVMQSPGDKDGANPPGEPTKISPQKGALRVGMGEGAEHGGDTVVVPPFSYVVVQYGGGSQ